MTSHPHFYRNVAAEHGSKVLAILTDPSSVAIALSAVADGKAPLDPLQERFLDEFDAKTLECSVFKCFVGHCMRVMVMEPNGRPLVAQGVSLPSNRKIWLTSAAVYQA